MKVGDGVVIIARESVYKGISGRIVSKSGELFLVKFRKPVDKFNTVTEYELMFSEEELQEVKKEEAKKQ